MNAKEIFKNIGFTQVAVLLLMVIPYFVIYLPRELFFALTREDGFFENVSAVYYFVATIGCFLLFARARHFRGRASQATYSNMPRRYVFLGLGLIFLISLGEEISWGQRILGYDTPEAIAARNVQGEFNFHNLEVFNPRTMDETPKEGLGAIFTARRVFIMLFGFYLFVLPLAAAVSPAIRRLLAFFYIPVPPLWMGVFYAGNILLYMSLNKAFADNQVLKNGISEVEELNISFLLMLIPMVWLSLPHVLGRKSPEGAPA